MHEIVEEGSVSVALRMMSMYVAEEYSIKFESLAGMNLMNALVRSVDGAYTVSGGFPALRRSLANTILATGGTVCLNASVSELIFNKDNSGVMGVRIGTSSALTCTRGVISGAGILTTFAHLIPLSSSSPALTAARMKLKGLEEQRPKMAVVFWVSGNAKSLGLSSCEYVEVSIDEEAKGSFRVWSPSARDETWSQR